MDGSSDGDETPSRAAKKQWTVFFQRCLQRRIPSTKLADLAASLSTRTPAPSTEICDALLDHQLSLDPDSSTDPLIPQYVDALVDARVVPPDRALLYYWRNSVHRHAAAQHDEQHDARCVPLRLEEALFASLAQMTHAPASLLEARTLLKAAEEWMKALVGADAAGMVMDEGSASAYVVGEGVMRVRQAVGLFVLALIGSAKVCEAFEAGAEFKPFADALSSYVHLLFDSMRELAEQLALAQAAHASLQPETTGMGGTHAQGDAALGELQLANIMDAPVVLARFSLAIYLDALLFGSPLINDHVLLHYLRSRYSDDSAAVTWLIVAAFDVLAAASNRGEVEERMFLLRSFLINKVPAVLVAVANFSFGELNFEYNISHALSQLDPTQFPTFSAGFESDSRETRALMDTKQDFLFACALFGLIQEDGIERLLNENPMQSVQTRLSKSELVATSSGSSQKLEQLIGRLESMDGNGGVVVEALTEIFHGLCASKDTMSLKGLCNQLSCRPKSLDVISLFVNPAAFLQPLCLLIENWTHDDEQGEYQPVYEEFSSCLLLVMAFVWRYQLKPCEIGVNPGQGFISRFLEQGALSLQLDELTEAQDQQLSGWTKALFETQIISDELMKICPPHDFYMLVPTLLKQSIIACRMEILALDTLKTGLELLLEAFLLPSLPYTLRWLTQHIRETPSDAPISIPILQALIVAPKLHGEALQMHTTILSLIARPLTNILSEVRRLEPANSPQPSHKPELSAVLDKFHPHLNYCRVPTITNTDLTAWSAPPRGAPLDLEFKLGSNLTAGLRNTLHVLVLWSTQGGSTGSLPMPTYAYPQLHANVCLIGALPTLRAMLDEVKAQYTAGFPAVMADIVATLVASSEVRRSLTALALAALPVPISAQHLKSTADLTLVDALRLDLASAATIILTDHLRAQLLVQLSRAIDRALTLPPDPAPPVNVADVNLAIPTVSDMGNAMASFMDMPLDSTENLGGAGMELDLGGLLGTDGGQHGAQVDGQGEGEMVVGELDDDVFGNLGDLDDSASFF